jgi:hypothetical protein
VARKIAIIAKAATSAFAPYEDPSWEVWGMPWIEYWRTPDLLFDVHSAECWLHGPMPKEEQRDWERKVRVPILTHPDRCYLFKTARPFPFEEVERLTANPFFENTVAYQLAYALLSHQSRPIEEVGLFGINMMGKREYLWERASVTYWAGVLEGRGIKVTTPPGAALFMSYWMAGKYGVTAEKRFTL